LITQEQDFAGEAQQGSIIGGTIFGHQHRVPSPAAEFGDHCHHPLPPFTLSACAHFVDIEHASLLSD
jgi:hypothetical protein